MAKHDAKPLRTVLFCAGSEERDIVEGFRSGADSIVIDLEEPRTTVQRGAARRCPGAGQILPGVAAGFRARPSSPGCRTLIPGRR